MKQYDHTKNLRRTPIRTGKFAFLFVYWCLLLGGGNPGLLMAQNVAQKIEGIVLDQGKQPVVGATVLVKNTSVATTTRKDGFFAITAKASDIIVVSSIGYQTEEVKITDPKQKITVTLKEDVIGIADVVVSVGYGQQRHRDVTGSVGVAPLNDILKAPVVSFDQALQGRIAGVNISSADGQPGNEMNIVIRGSNSLTQSNSPLYVVDGFPLDDFSSAAINQSDIASISILKDASSTAIYGSRGANGVIIIETKQGKEGRPVVQYNGTYGFQKVTRTMDMMNPYEFVRYQIELNPNNADIYLTNEGRTLDDYKQIKGIDWQDKMFHLAPMHMHNLSLSGGTRQTRYNISFGATDQQGVIRWSGYQKYQGRISLTQQINDKIRAIASVSYTEDKTYGQTSSASLSTNNAYSTFLMYRTWAYRPVLVSGQSEEDLFDDDMNVGVMNPVISNRNEDNTKKVRTFFSNLRLEYRPIKDLKLMIRGGYTKRNTRNEQFNNSQTYRGYPSPSNNVGVNANYLEITKTDWMNENTLTYTKRINHDHNFDVMVGMTLQGTSSNRYGFSTSFIPNEHLGMSGMDDGIAYDPVALMTENRLMSYLGRINYSYKSRYMLTVSARADGSSRFRKDNRWGFFPSAAFAWRMSSEKFMKGLKFIDDAKLRVSYGITGNDRIGDYSTYAALSVSDYYSFNNTTPSTAIIPSSLGNAALKWESTEQIDIGYNLSMFKSRVNITLDLYRKTTRDLLIKSNLPYTTGYTSEYDNIGKVRNDGLEITLNTVNIDRGNFRWTSDFNISFNRNRVLALAKGEETYLSKVSFTGNFNNSNLYIARIGEPMAQFYGVIWDGVYGYEDFDQTPSGTYTLKPGVPTNGDDRSNIQPGDIKYVDINGDLVVNDADRVVIGRCLPIHTGGFNNNFTYKNLTLNVFFQWNYGNDIYNANRLVFEGNFSNRSINQYSSYIDRWSPENPDSRNHRTGGAGPMGIYSSKQIEDGSFLRLKTVQLSYRLPERWLRKIGISTLEIFLSGQNLHTWTNYSGLDPEVSTRHTALTPGFDYSAYARNKIFTAGVNITF